MAIPAAAHSKSANRCVNCRARARTIEGRPSAGRTFGPCSRRRRAASTVDNPGRPITVAALCITPSLTDADNRGRPPRQPDQLTPTVTRVSSYWYVR